MPKLKSPSPFNISVQGPVAFAEVRRLLEEAKRLLVSSTRYYKLSEDACVSVSPSSDGFLISPFTIRGSEWNWRDLNEMKPVELAKLAEVRSMCDDWVSGKLPVLPPSTFTPPSNLPSDSPSM